MKYKYTFIIFLFLILSLGSCKQQPAKDKQKTLTVTIEPQRFFLEKIAGNHFKIETIVPSSSNPESADFTPSQIKNLSNSTIYFTIGYLGIENALIDKIITNDSNLKIVNCSKGIKPIGEIHNHEGQHDHGHVGGDPHTWSSVKSAKIIVENMYKALLEIDKANEMDYTSNYNKLLAELNQTDSIIKTYLEKAENKAFIIYHPALSYFADEYGLTQYSIELNGKTPSPSQLKQLIDTAKSNGVKVIFIQKEFDTKNAKTIANEIGGKDISINLLSYHWDEEMIKIAKAMTLK